MSEAERTKPEFLCPKRWFPAKDWKRTKKQKIFSLVTSNGKVFATKIELPWTAERFSTMVRTELGPWLRRTFRSRTSFQILLDNEKVMKAPPALAALADNNIKVLPGWPAHSPELNPQENVWPWAEARVRELEKSSDTFEQFGTKVLAAVRAYPSATKLITSMAKRMQDCIDNKGAAIMK